MSKDPITKDKKDSGHIVAVVGIILNSADKILMINNPRRGWELPGGQVEAGEDLIQALGRETMEETGIKADIDKLLAVYSRLEAPFVVTLSFRGSYKSGKLFSNEDSLAIEWLDPKQALLRIAHPAIRGAVEDFLKGSEQVVYRSYSIDPYEIRCEYQF